MLFSTYFARKLKPQSIEVYIFAIRNLHLEQGLPDPLLHATGLRRLLWGIKRTLGTSPDSRLPITPSILRTFRTLLDLHFYDHTVLWAGILTAFFGFLRSSELLALKHEYVRRQSEAYAVRIRSSKTDPFRSGASIRLMPSGEKSLCPVEALGALKRRCTASSGPLRTFSDGTIPTRQRLNVLIKMLATRSGTQLACYSSHSFWIGAASAAAAAGMPDWEIQALGRWSSDCYQRYIRLPDTSTSNIVAILARSRL